MSYLSYSECKELAQDIELLEREFEQLLLKASDVLDNDTSHFYALYDIVKDNSCRVKQFKKALCAQIESFNEVGSTTYEGINSTPRSFTAGRTTVTNDSRYKTSGENESRPLISNINFLYIDGTGLLFAAVSLC